MKKILLFLTMSILPESGYCQTIQYQGDLKELLKGPDSPGNYIQWLSLMRGWRAKVRDSLHLSDQSYLPSKLQWRKKCFIYTQMMVEDLYFYNPVTRRYTVDRYLNDLYARYGGLDAVLIWPTYPNIGIDNRNQFDMLKDMPGGLSGVKKMVADFHKRGVAVFFPIMYWDRGTKPFGKDMAAAIIQEMKAIGADGLNGDTMFGVDSAFRDASDSLHYPIVLQPEVAVNDLKMLSWNQMSWGYYWKYSYMPGVSVYKWLEPKHQVHVTNRWVIDKTDDLQYAFFNGVGFNSWENIWGVWNQIPDRYAEVIRRMATIYRTFPDAWDSPEWQPHIPIVQRGVFASAFPTVGYTIYTFVNRDSIGKNGVQIELSYDSSLKYYDLWNGIKVHPLLKGKKVSLQFPMEGNGYGVILVSKKENNLPDMSTLLRQMRSYARRTLQSYSTEWHPLRQKIVRISPSIKAKKVPDGMVLIPAVQHYNFESIGVMVEGDDLPNAVGIQHPWEKHPARSQKHTLDIAAFYMDKYPVTNEQFRKFIQSTNYYPADDHNFLKDWQNGKYPKGWESKPVTWISIEDARAYAVWAGKRLPHEWEWQYAAQGKGLQSYPWGSKMDSTKIPSVDTSRNMRAPTSVMDFPQSASPFGVMDMVGNIWQWTDEYRDTHTRAAVLKGSSYFRPQTSAWYFPTAYEVNKYGKYLLLSPGKDRSGTIGFRCVKDTEIPSF